MNLSRRWLEAFLGRALDPKDLTERLAMLGAPVDAVEPLHAGLGEIVIARVEAVRPHPNADRLRVCAVEDGSGTLRNVVCGAANVAAGRYYPFMRVGSTLPGGLRIERRKLRGELSEGMLCSARELGLGDDHDGILELEGTWEPGAPFAAALGLGRRPPGHRRHAQPSRPPRAQGRGARAGHLVGIPVPSPRICRERTASSRPSGARRPRRDGRRPGPHRGHGAVRAVPRCGGAGRSGRLLAGMAPPRLEAAGMRSINNVVDATNYVLLELNQPMHAYDLAALAGNLVSARPARPGERLVTLDGQERELAEGMPVIADGTGAVGVAGVMGARPPR
jgi:phenylalanyl-tRNA synthetase beta chain